MCCLQDGATKASKASAEDDSHGHGQHTFTVAFKKYEDGALLINELYPQLKAEPLAKGKSVRISGDHDLVERAGALLGELGMLKPTESWALITNSVKGPMSSAIAASRLKVRFPNVSAYYSESSNQILLFGDRAEVQAIADDVRQWAKQKPGWQEQIIHTGSVVPSVIRPAFKEKFPDAVAIANDDEKTLLVSVPKAMTKQVDEWFWTQYPALFAPKAGPNQAANRPQVETMVRKEFDARQKVHAAELQLLKQKLKELETRIQTHERLKEQMISNRVDALLADPSMARKSATARTVRKSKPTDPYKVQPGDTLGIFIPYILGQEGEKPPIHTDPTGVRPPAMGYPVSVRDDGTISLPVIKAQKVAGLTLRGVEARLIHVLTVEQNILKKGTASVMVSLLRSVDDPIPEIRQGTGGSPTARTNGGRRASGKIQPGDTRGLVGGNVLGDSDESPPIHTDPTGIRPPAMGYPFQVRADGTIGMPLLGSVKAAGLSVGEFAKSLRRAFQEENVVAGGKSVIMASMIRSNNDSQWQELPAIWSSESAGDRNGARANLAPAISAPAELFQRYVALRAAFRAAQPNSAEEADARTGLALLLEEHQMAVRMAEHVRNQQNAAYKTTQEKLKFNERMAKRGYAADSEIVRMKQEVLDARVQAEQSAALLASLSKLNLARFERPDKSPDTPTTSLVKIFKTPSEFADSVAVISSGAAGDGATARFNALKKEYELQLSLIRSELEAAKEGMVAANAALMRVQKLAANKVASTSALRTAELRSSRQRAKVKQLMVLQSAYQEIMPDELPQPTSPPRGDSAAAAIQGLAVQILNSPSQFADKFVEVEEQASSGNGNERRKGITRFKALQAEYQLQLSLLQSAVDVAKIRLVTSEGNAERAQSEVASGLSSAATLNKANAELAAERSQLQQLADMLKAYQAIRPRKAGEKRATKTDDGDFVTPKKQ
ncbi:MAG: polysaccharide biosynthesis/export family protein, partial [Planctomycetaceae bacterium]